jgi:AcrR family transcriptional regulator
MPRISAPTVADHVARQEGAVLRAAAKLFAERGFAAVTMGDIAAEVGLKRNSLYRYFPDKDHLLLACFRNEIDQLVALATPAKDSRSGRERLRRWITVQFDYATQPEHRLFVELANELGALDPQVRTMVEAEHERLYATATQIVADALTEAERAGHDPVLVAQMVSGLLRAGAEAVAHGTARNKVRSELLQAALAIVDGSSSVSRQEG